MTDPLIDTLRALLKQWREREQVLLRKADAQGVTQYAHRLAAEAEGCARCADQLSSFILFTLLDQAKGQERTAENYPGFDACGMSREAWIGAKGR